MWFIYQPSHVTIGSEEDYTHYTLIEKVNTLLYKSNAFFSIVMIFYVSIVYYIINKSYKLLYVFIINDRLS